MTKRFIIDASGDFRDTKDGSTIIDFGYAHNSMECKMILDLLNELHEENLKLKSENNMLRTTIGRNEEYIDRLTHKSKWSNNSQELDEEYLHPSKRPMRFIG